jgi:hypothetical protein
MKRQNQGFGVNIELSGCVWFLSIAQTKIRRVIKDPSVTVENWEQYL